MGDFPQLQTADLFGSVITIGSAACLGETVNLLNTGPFTSAVWPTTNLAIFVPFILAQHALATQMSHQNGAAVSGNVDVGIYDERGNRLISKGSTAQAGISSLQVHDITDTELVPGVYFKAIAVDNTTATILRGGMNIQPARACGMAQMATAFPLPNPATFAAISNAYLPSIAVHFAAGAV
jgi:hypothetical protein